MTKAQNRLQGLLRTVPAGKIDDMGPVIGLLEACWNDVEGNALSSMTSAKLRRIETMHWKPPILEFAIERHGATVLGSSLAEVQSWSLDVSRLEATCETAKRRQVSPRQPTFDTAALAAELADAIKLGLPDFRLQFSKYGSVTIYTHKALPKATKETTNGRSSRLLNAIGKLLLPDGWVLDGNICRKQSAAASAVAHPNTNKR